MTPESVRLVAEMVRSHRTTATAFEKWVKVQPYSQASREMLQMLAVYRGVLEDVEAKFDGFVGSTSG